MMQCKITNQNNKDVQILTENKFICDHQYTNFINAHNYIVIFMLTGFKPCVHTKPP